MAASSATRPSERDLAGRRIVVAGAAGFIGRHLVSHLLRRGADVTALHRSTPGRADVLTPPVSTGALHWVAVDLTDQDAVLNLTGPFDTVVNLAGVSSAPHALEYPLECFTANSLTTLHLLDVCRRRGAQLVFVSTVQVYGRPEYLPVDERHPVRPTHPYASSKLTAEIMVRAYQTSYAVPTIILRPSNIYGPRQSNLAVVAELTEQALTGTLSPRALTPVRDFIYVADFVRAVGSAIKVGSVEEPINISCGIGASIQAIADMLIELSPIVGLEPPILITPIETETTRPDETFFSSRLAEALLDWKAEVSLRDGLLACLRYAIGEGPSSAG